jgi:hypothetical protein
MNFTKITAVVLKLQQAGRQIDRNIFCLCSLHTLWAKNIVKIRVMWCLKTSCPTGRGARRVETLRRKYLHAYQLSHINTEPNLHLEQGKECYVNTV